LFKTGADSASDSTRLEGFEKFAFSLDSIIIIIMVIMGAGQKRNPLCPTPC